MSRLVHIPVKPLSANLATNGRKTKSWAYRLYEEDVTKLLPRIRIPRKGKLLLLLDVYYSNSGADLDNAIKPFLDILQKRYAFNDNRVYKIVANKYVVPKGEEGIAFKIEEFKNEEA